jgi:hypothetical protein
MRHSLSHAPRLRALASYAALAALPFVSGACKEDSGPVQTRENAFVWEGTIQPGKTIRVRELQGGIEVVPSTDDKVRVTARYEWRRGNPDEGLSLSASDADGDLLVCAVWGSGGSCTKEDYNANIRTGRGAGRTDAKVFFRIEAPRGVKIDLVVISGDIQVAASAPVMARSVNGDVVVATAVGPVEAETMNGSVDIRMSSLTGTDTVKAETMNGDAFVYLPADIDASVEMEVMNGSVSSEFAAQATGENRKHVSVRLGQGTHAVRAKTLNGAVALRRLDASGRAGGQ